MDDDEFLNKMLVKIERMTGKEIQLDVDRDNESRITVDFAEIVPQVTLGFGVLRYPGFARMSVEYVVASIRRNREINQLEFHVLLQRN